jgi:hypothetical protein
MYIRAANIWCQWNGIVECIEFDLAEPDHLFVGTGGEGARYIYKVASRGRYFTALTAATLAAKPIPDSSPITNLTGAVRAAASMVH